MFEQAVSGRPGRGPRNGRVWDGDVRGGIPAAAALGSLHPSATAGRGAPGFRGQTVRLPRRAPPPGRGLQDATLAAYLAELTSLRRVPRRRDWAWPSSATASTP